MEEVDKIIIVTFRQIGVDVPEDVLSLKQFTPDLVVSAATRCLSAIDERKEFPDRLPPEMSARFRMCSNIAKEIKALGYADDLDYHQFLYLNETEVRKMFMWLVERLPRESSEESSEPIGVRTALFGAITGELNRRKAAHWTLPYCRKGAICRMGKAQDHFNVGTRASHTIHTVPISFPHGTADITIKIPKLMKEYYATMPFACDAPQQEEDVHGSLLEANVLTLSQQREWEDEWNTHGLASGLSEAEYRSQKRTRIAGAMGAHVASGRQAKAGVDSLQGVVGMFAKRSTRANAKGTRFTNAAKLQFTQEGEGDAVAVDSGVDREEELKRRREEELAALQARIDELIARIAELDAEMGKHAGLIVTLNADAKAQLDMTPGKEAAYKVRKKVMDLLPEADKNIALLEQMIEQSAGRMMELATQWEKHRTALIAQMRREKELQKERMGASHKQLEQIREFREKMRLTAEEAREKEELYKQLVAEYENMDKSIHRSMFTRRIAEIVANIQKQTKDITKVLLDTRALQKDSNILGERVQRTFLATQDLIWAAKSNESGKGAEAAKTSYKMLAGLREKCTALVTMVEETGKLLNEIRDLEERIGTIRGQNVEHNMEKILADLEDIRRENEMIEGRVKRME